MWKPIINKMKSMSESERLEQLEDDVRAQKKRTAELKKRVEELEKKKNDN